MKNLLSNIFAITIALAPTIASAEESAPTTFRHDGITYTYTTEHVGERKVLRGVSSASREPFVLYVGKAWVDGTANGTDVSFSLKSVKRIRGMVIVDQLAAR